MYIDQVRSNHYIEVNRIKLQDKPRERAASPNTHSESNN